MIYIFHGDNQFDSRTAFNDILDKYKNAENLRLDSKNTDPDLINVFLQSSSLFNDQKVLAITNLFSAPRANLDKIIKIINKTTNCDIIIWQDKKLTLAQINSLPKPKVQSYALDNKLFSCLNAIKPKNLKTFIPAYEDLIKTGIYDLFLYLFKGNIRKQLTSYSHFSESSLKRTYLTLIELDFQNKTGQLSIPKEMALERIIINLIK